MVKIPGITRTIIAALFIASAGLSTAAGEGNDYNHHLGVAASSLSGIGLSYGYNFHPDYMFRVCGIYTESNDRISGTSQYTKDIWWNAGAEIQRFLFIIPSGNVAYTGYGLAGSNCWYSNYEDPLNPQDNNLNKRWTAGAAMGLRVVFFERIALNLEFGYQYSRDIVEETVNTGLAAGAGAHFVF